MRHKKTTSLIRTIHLSEVFSHCTHEYSNFCKPKVVFLPVTLASVSAQSWLLWCLVGRLRRHERRFPVPQGSWSGPMPPGTVFLTRYLLGSNNRRHKWQCKTNNLGWINPTDLLATVYSFQNWDHTLWKARDYVNIFGGLAITRLWVSNPTKLTADFTMTRISIVILLLNHNFLIGATPNYWRYTNVYMRETGCCQLDEKIA